jgi:glyoxylase-like metal-dependent hydrolase (beta-lactamase superfamily II)
MLRPRELSRSITVFPAKTPTLPPATHTNSYALGARDVILVEPATPYDDEQRAWVEWVRGLEAAGRRPVALVATHHHEDHVGGVAFLARELGLPVWAHAATAKRIADRLPKVDRELVEGDRLVLDGPEPEAWSVFFTPGHAPGHVCLFEPQAGALVVGDMLASRGTILIAPGDGDMQRYLAELARLRALGARVALPAHGDPIDDPAKLFGQYIDHRLRREAKVATALAAHGAAGATPVELVSTAYDDTPFHLWPVAVLSLTAHLEKLAKDGAARDLGPAGEAAPGLEATMRRYVAASAGAAPGGDPS